jgi:predicted ATP-grasp superfamily ATP-dependent carboligase
MKMSPRVLLLVLGFLALSSAFEVKNLLKTLQKREVSSSLLSKSGNLNTLIRKRRDAEESAEPTSGEVISILRFFVSVHI